MENQQISNYVFESRMNRLVEKVATVFNTLLFIQLAATALILVVNITTRYLIGFSIKWANNISRYAYIYIVLLGTAVSYKENLHAKITILYNAMPKKIKFAFNTLHYAVMMFLSVFLIVKGTVHVVTMWPVTDPIMDFFSMGIVYISVPLSAAAIFLFVILKIVSLIKHPG